MQTMVLENVLAHIEKTYHFDQEEMRSLIKLLHKTLSQSATILSSDDAEAIYHHSHTLHSELNICGYQVLVLLITDIELQSKKGIIERSIITDFLQQSDAFVREIEAWIAE